MKIPLEYLKGFLISPNFLILNKHYIILEIKFKQFIMKKIITIVLIYFAFNNIANAQTPYIGEIRMFAGNFAPSGWAKCEGQLLSIAQNAALFSILGTTYGGDGQTTFGLPDLRGRVPLGPGTGPGLSPRSLGQKSGNETNTMSVAQMPAHSHTINAVIADGNQSTPTGNLLAGTKLLDPEYSNASNTTTMNSAMVGNTGNSQSINNMQPYQSVTFIIALVGVFPSPN